MDWLTAILIWLSADQTTIEETAASAAAAVDCAYASMPRVEAKQAKPAVGGKPVLDCPTGNCPLPRR